jgi:hypothetical protein
MVGETGLEKYARKKLFGGFIQFGDSECPKPLQGSPLKLL